MGCTACAKRRAKLKALKEQKKANRQGLQAAVLGGVIAVSEAVGHVLGEEIESGEEVSDSHGDASREGDAGNG